VKINRHFDEIDFLIYLNGSFSINPREGTAAPPDEYLKANRAFTKGLRSLVDEWLDSARSENGFEEPHKRRPKKRGVKALYEFRHSNGPKSYWAEDGDTELIFPLPRRTVNAVGKEDPVEDARYELYRQFSTFMDETAFKGRIAKCRDPRCGIYYANRRKLTNRYQAGTYCESCRHKVTAKRSAKKSRTRELELRLSLAAKFWRAFRPKHGDRNTWIKSQINDNLPAGHSYVDTNWVRLHTKEISTMAQQLKPEITGGKR
jgi:hypothetical protein